MRTLLRASESLQSFMYWTGDKETGLENFSSHELVVMLEPFKDTLEELLLEIVPIGTEKEEEGRLTTLAHFTALKKLDTTAAMWKDLTDERLDAQPITAEQLLCHRLPSNMGELILHSPPKVEGIRDDWYMPNSPDKRQIQSIILNHKRILPKLHHLFIGSACDKRGRYLNLIFLEQYRTQYPDLKIIVGKGRPRCAPTRSFFDDFLYAPKPPETKWDGEKYSVLSYSSGPDFQADVY